jgi:RNA recognition motif-containing protein
MEVGKFFENYGNVKSVKIFENNKGEETCSGFVNFEDIDSVEVALKADGCILFSNKINV